MYASLVAALALAASVSQVTASPVTHVARGYRQDADILEDYTPYHVRYLALNCQGQHNTQFFEDCCHPLLRWQKLSERPAKCIPSASASASAAAAEPTATPIDEDPIPDYDDDDCEDPTSTPAAVAATPSPEPTSTKAPVTKAAATSSYKPETTPAPETTPEPTTTKKASSAEPTPTSAPSGGSGSITGGFATFFEQRGVAGACGKVHAETDKVVALDYRRYGALNKQSDDCGRSVTITNTKNGKTVTAIVADACPTCENENCLDLSYGAFDAIATREEGMVPIEWHFN